MSTDRTATISVRHDGEQQPSDPHSLSSRHRNLFDKLATETIGEIFSHAYPTVDLPIKTLQKDLRNGDISNPGILLMVCKRWHAITLSNHSLWATITIRSARIKKRTWVLWGFAQLRSSLGRSGAYPLNIRVDGDNKDTVISGILDVLIPHSERWRIIAFTFPMGPKFIQELNTLDGRLPLLEHLEINLSDDRYSEDEILCTAFLSASKLTSLSITPSEGTDTLPKIQIPWKQISCVTFSHSDFDAEEDFYEILGYVSDSLTSLTFGEDFDTKEWPESDRGKFTLPRLRRLHVSHDCFHILDVLVCPSLEELKITDAFAETITTLLDSSSCTLTHITFGQLLTTPFSAGYPIVLQHPSLSTLKSMSLSEYMRDPITDLLNFNSHRLFPWLETLILYPEFSSVSGGRKGLLSQVDALRKVVDSRTRPASLNRSELPVHGFDYSEVPQAPKCYLRKCFFHFKIEFGILDFDEWWIEETMMALQSFCISRDLRISVEFSYW